MSDDVTQAEFSRRAREATADDNGDDDGNGTDTTQAEFTRRARKATNGSGNGTDTTQAEFTRRASEATADDDEGEEDPSEVTQAEFTRRAREATRTEDEVETPREDITQAEFTRRAREATAPEDQRIGEVDPETIRPQEPEPDGTLEGAREFHRFQQVEEDRRQELLRQEERRRRHALEKRIAEDVDEQLPTDIDRDDIHITDEGDVFLQSEAVREIEREDRIERAREETIRAEGERIAEAQREAGALSEAERQRAELQQEVEEETGLQTGEGFEIEEEDGMLVAELTERGERQMLEQQLEEEGYNPEKAEFRREDGELVAVPATPEEEFLIPITDRIRSAGGRLRDRFDYEETDASPPFDDPGSFFLDEAPIDITGTATTARERAETRTSEVVTEIQDFRREVDPSMGFAPAALAVDTQREALEFIGPHTREAAGRVPRPERPERPNIFDYDEVDASPPFDTLMEEGSAALSRGRDRAEDVVERAVDVRDAARDQAFRARDAALELDRDDMAAFLLGPQHHPDVDEAPFMGDAPVISPGGAARSPQVARDAVIVGGLVGGALGASAIDESDIMERRERGEREVRIPEDGEFITREEVRTPEEEDVRTGELEAPEERPVEDVEIETPEDAPVDERPEIETPDEPPSTTRDDIDVIEAEPFVSPSVEQEEGVEEEEERVEVVRDDLADEETVEEMRREERDEIARQAFHQTMFEQEERFGEIEREEIIEADETEQLRPSEMGPDPDIVERPSVEERFGRPVDEMTEFERRTLLGQMGLTRERDEMVEEAERPGVMEREDGFERREELMPVITPGNLADESVSQAMMEEAGEAEIATQLGDELSIEDTTPGVRDRPLTGIEPDTDITEESDVLEGEQTLGVEDAAQQPDVAPDTRAAEVAQEIQLIQEQAAELTQETPTRTVTETGQATLTTTPVTTPGVGTPFLTETVTETTTVERFPAADTGFIEDQRGRDADGVAFDQDDGVLSPGWLTETVETIARGGRGMPESPAQQDLRDAPIEERLTGELPTAALIDGDDETVERIAEVQQLFGVGGEDEEPESIFDFGSGGDEDRGGLL